jgi:isocitrate dehydrogenase
VPGSTVVVLHGDQTGEELLLEAKRLLAKDVIGFEVGTKDFDLSLERRRETRNQVVLDAAESLREAGFGLKAATIIRGHRRVGSPNAILRKQVDGRVTRTGRRILGVRPLAGVHAPFRSSGWRSTMPMGRRSGAKDTA